MGFLSQNNAQAESEQSYSFASGGIEDFENELQMPKQQQDIDEAEGLEDLGDLEEPEMQEGLRAKASVANSTGSLLALTIDSIIPTGLAMLADEDDPSEFKASPDEHDELKKVLSEYTKLKGADIPPGVGVLLVLLAIYGPKAFMAVKLRKANKLNREQAERIKDLEDQLRNKEQSDDVETHEDERE